MFLFMEYRPFYLFDIDIFIFWFMAYMVCFFSVKMSKKCHTGKVATIFLFMIYRPVYFFIYDI